MDAHEFAAGGTEVNRKCSNHRQHPTIETDVKTKDRPAVAAVLCKATHAGTEDQIRDDQDKTIAYLIGDEFYDETTDE